MQNESFYKNHPIFKLSGEVQLLCQEFFSALNLNFFDYVRFNNNNNGFIGLVSDGLWLEHFFRNQFTIGCTVKTSGVHLWESYRESAHLHDATKIYNHHYGISIFNQGEDYIEYFEFAAPRENKEILSVYLNNFDVFKKFCSWFKKSSNKLFNQVESHPIPIPETMQGQSTPSLNLNPAYRAAYADFQLTKRQQQCLHYYLCGMTAKETAKILGISYRTVEEYIESVKRKLGCHHKRDLLKLLQSS